MNEITLRMRKALAFILIWVLMFNSMPMIQLSVNAQESVDATVSGGDVSGGDVSGGDVSGGDVSGGDVSGGDNGSNDDTVSDGDSDIVISSVEDNLFSLSCIDMDTENYSYEVETVPENANEISEGIWDISGCDFPCYFKIKLTPKNVTYSMLRSAAVNNAGVKYIIVQIDKLHTELKFDFNNQSDKIVYGTTKAFSFDAQFVDNEGNEAPEMADGREIQYSVVDIVDVDEKEVEQADSQIVSIVDNEESNDEKDKLLVFNDNGVGKFRVKASVKESDRYDACEVTRDFVVVNQAKPNEDLILKADENGNAIERQEIYYHDVYVCAPEGYVISENNSIENVDWKNLIKVSHEGNKQKVFYLKNTATGGITDKYSIDINIDKTLPRLSGVELSQWFEIINVWGNTIENDYEIDSQDDVWLYYKDNVTMIFTIDEANFDISKVNVVDSYYGNSEQVLEWVKISQEIEDHRWKATYTIDKDDTGDHVITLKYYEDNNKQVPVINYTSEHIHMISNQSDMVGLEYEPECEYVEDIASGTKMEGYNEGTSRDVNLYYSNDEVILKFTENKEYLNNANIYVYDSADYENRVQLEWKWNGWDNPQIASHTISDEGEHVITLCQIPWGKRINNGFTLEHIIIDRTPPSIKGLYEGTLSSAIDKNGDSLELNDDYVYGTKLSEEEENKEENKDENDVQLYYTGDVKLNFIVTEKHLINSAERIYVTDSYDGQKHHFDDWVQGEEENEWIFSYTIPNSQEGKHKLTFTCIDKAGNPSTYTTEDIYVRKINAELKSVKYSEWLDKVTWDEEYNAENYEIGDNPEMLLYFDNSMSITFEIGIDIIEEDCIQLVDDYAGIKEEVKNYHVSKGEDNSYLVTYEIPDTKPGKHIVSLKYADDQWYQADFEWKSEELCVVDTVAPELNEVCYTGFNSVESLDDTTKDVGKSTNTINDTMRVFSNSKVTMCFSVKEINEEDINKIVLVDESDVEVDLTWSKVNEETHEWIAYHTVDEVGEKVFHLTYENERQEGRINYTSAHICIDKTASNLEKITYSVSSGDAWTDESVSPESNTAKEGNRYYNKDVKVTYEISEEYFRAEDVKITDTISDENIKWDIEYIDDKAYITYYIPAENKTEGLHTVLLEYKDRAGNEEIAYTSNIVIDITAPELNNNEANYGNYASNEILENGKERLFYGSDMKLTFVVTEKNFVPADFVISDSYPVEPEKMDVSFNQLDKEQGIWEIIYVIPASQEGDHEVSISYSDEAHNEELNHTSKIICMDKTAANLGAVTYSAPIYTEDLNEGNTKVDSNIVVYYKDTMTVTFEIIEENFRVEDVVFSDSFYKEDDDVTYDLNWSKGNSTNCWVGTYIIDNSDKAKEGEHILNLKYKDRVSEDYTVDYTSKKIIMDTTAPEDGGISYTEPVRDTDEALYYKDSATISFKIIEQNFHKEGIKLVDEFVRNYDGQTFYYMEDGGKDKKRLDYIQEDPANENIWIVTYTVPIEEYGKHNVTLTYNDICQNGEIPFNPKTVVMDQPVGEFEDSDIIYSQQPSHIIETANEKTLYFVTQENDLTVEFIIEEDDFDDSKLTLTDSYYPNESIYWKTEVVDGIKVKVIYTINKEHEGEHVLTVHYQSSLDNGLINEVFDKIIIDSHNAVIDAIEYSEGKMEEDSKIYYNSTTDAKVTFFIGEKAFDKECLSIVDSIDNKEITGYVVNDSVYPVEVICTIPNDVDGEHQLTLTYDAKSKIGEVQCTTKTLVIDNTQALPGEINYSQWINAEKYPSDADEDGYGDLATAEEQMNLNNLYRLYYRDDITDASDDFVYVTFGIDEKNFHPAGVTVSATCDGVVEEITWTSDLKADTVTCSIPKSKEGEHVVTLTYQDRCGNGSPIIMTSKKIIVDNQVPSIDKSYTGWVSVRNDKGAAVTQYIAGSDSSLYLYYDKGTTLTFYINEKNFCEEDVVFLHERSCRADNVGTDVQNITREYSQENIALEWELVDGIWTATYILEDSQEGQHIFKLSYTDRSNNSAENYVSEHIILDMTPAKFADNSPVLNGECMWNETVDESGTVRKYYKDDMSIAFEIDEANFYPEDVVLRDSHDPNGTDIIIPWNWDENKNVWVGTYTIPKDKSGEHIVTLKYQDRTSGEPSINYTSEYIVMDGNRSNLDQVIYNVGWDTAENIHSKNKIVDYTARADVNNVRLYYKNDMVITFVVSEDNFHKEDVVFIDQYQGHDNKITLDWQQQAGSNAWIATHTIYKTEEGEHRLTLSYNDRSGNDGVYYLSEYIMMDEMAPTLESVGFTPYKQAVDAGTFATIPDYQIRQNQEQGQSINLYYDATMTMTFTIKETNFNSDDVKVYDNGKQLPKLNWQQQENSNIWSATHTIADVGEHVIALEYYDRSLNAPILYTSEKIILDTTKPELGLAYKDGLKAHTVVNGVSYYGANQQLKISIKEDNFRASDVAIAITTKDAVAAVDIDKINAALKDPAKWTKENGVYVATVDFDTDAYYDITVMYKDLAVLEADNKNSIIVVDNQVPEKHSLTTEEAYDTNSEAFKRMVDETDKKVSVADAKTRFIYQDAMTFKFAMKEINFDASQVQLRVYRDDKLLENGDGYSYTPNGNWKTDATSYIHTLTLELGKKNGELVDGNYKVEIAYTDQAGHALKTYISNTITIDQTNPVIVVDYDNKEANNESYYNKNRVATITVTDRNVVSEEIIVNVTATDIDGNVVPFDLATKQSSWKFDKSSNTWTSKVTYDVDAKYDFTIDCKDMATNGAFDDDSFTVDKLAPSKDSFRFEYSTALPDKGDSNNAFYKDKVTVKIIAEDVTSPIDYFEWTYIKQPGASSINQETENHIIHNSDSAFVYDETKRTATAEFTLTADQAKQYRGNMRFKATDMAGNTSEELTDAERIVIVDTISPTRMVEYSPASQIVNKETLHTLTGFDYAIENVGAVLLYNKPMTVTFKVNEANFYADDIVVKVNDVEKTVTNWTKAADVWTGSLPISENGEYIVTLQYTDRSTNEMVDYVSHKIIIDTVKPQIHINYGPNDIKQNLDGIKYYDKKQTATITITERNFRADDIEVIVKATDVNGNNIHVTDYDGYLRSRSSWTKQGDSHTAQITFATDANYEFDIMYKDLALIPADDYVNDVFTVDQTAPTNVSVSYSSPIFEKNIQGTAYEYYNEPIVVTITAEDDISGIYSFDYHYIRADGVSSVNAENVANKIEAQKITYSNGKKTATATFVLPASELRNGTQINGNMEYVAYNRALTTTEYKDPRRYVVDNIVPNVTVEYNDYVDNENNISYYADDIDVTITVDEANFFADDVKVSISKDGGEQSPANVSWRTVSVDKHVGSFTLEEEGNYKVYVTYQDPATNKMGEYQSNQLTIDKTKPVVSVSGIRYNSANKKDKIGFVVTAEDINLNTKSFSPKLMAEIRDESGKLKQVDCTELGTIETVVNGKSCTYTIGNIDQDGIYRFSCEVSDMSGNTTEDMMITDSGDKTVSKLDYSVNRNGSTYGLDESTKKLNNSFIREAKDVIVYETNPDEISNIKITLFKNDKAIVLVEGKDYVVNKISEDGEWYKYEYIIYATNFMEDGTYRISIYSEDKAGNVAENNLDVKNVEINFGVDNTLPNLIVTNLEDKRTYPLDKLSVLMQATDNMRLVNITVELDGKVVATWDEEQIQQMSANLQDFVFDILGDTTQAHTVTITLTDIAGNQKVETISDFYVTRNLWIRFTNNKVLFYGSIMACLAVGFSFIPLWKRRKKRKEARG